MNPIEKLKQIAEYLLRLDENTRNIVIAIMAGQNYQTLDDNCTTPKPKDGETVNGYWSCINGQWVWIPEI